MDFIRNLMRCCKAADPTFMICVTVLNYAVPHLDEHMRSCVIHYLSNWILNEGTHSGHKLKMNITAVCPHVHGANNLFINRFRRILFSDPWNLNKMCLIHCRCLISAAAGFGQTGRGLKTSWSQRLSIAGGIGRKKMEGIKYAENVAEMFESNTPESPTSSVVVLKTKKRIQRDKRVFPFFSCFLPLSAPCGCIVLLHTLFLNVFFLHPRGHLWCISDPNESFTQRWKSSD